MFRTGNIRVPNVTQRSRRVGYLPEIVFIPPEVRMHSNDIVYLARRHMHRPKVFAMARHGRRDRILVARESSAALPGLLLHTDLRSRIQGETYSSSKTRAVVEVTRPGDTATLHAPAGVMFVTNALLVSLEKAQKPALAVRNNKGTQPKAFSTVSGQ
jgi:hypothetical protein